MEPQRAAVVMALARCLLSGPMVRASRTCTASERLPTLIMMEVIRWLEWYYRMTCCMGHCLAQGGSTEAPLSPSKLMVPHLQTFTVSAQAAVALIHTLV